MRSWAFTDAFPVKWTGPALNAGSNDVATETLEIAHHGFGGRADLDAPLNADSSAGLPPDRGRGGKLECWFNPNEYKIEKTTVVEKPVVGAGLPNPQFGGGNARELDPRPALRRLRRRDGDVRTVTDRLFKLMEVDQAFGSAKKGARR